MKNTIKNIKLFLFDMDGTLYLGNRLFDFTDKGNNIDQMMLYMFARTQSMFTWSGLPETIPCYMLEMYLQRNF